jgi:hypothetical protein
MGEPSMLPGEAPGPGWLAAANSALTSTSFIWVVPRIRKIRPTGSSDCPGRRGRLDVAVETDTREVR